MADPLGYIKKFVIALFLIFGGFVIYLLMKLIYGAFLSGIDTSGWGSVATSLLILVPVIAFIGIIVKAFLMIRGKSKPTYGGQNYAPRTRKTRLPWQ